MCKSLNSIYCYICMCININLTIVFRFFEINYKEKIKIIMQSCDHDLLYYNLSFLCIFLFVVGFN